MTTRIVESMIVSLTKNTVGLSDVDNTSDLNKPISTAAQMVLDGKAPIISPDFDGIPTVNGSRIETAALRGVANGYAALGADGKVPSINLPDNGSYKGNWNASTNSPTIVAGTGTNGDTYTVSVAGTQNVTGSSTEFSVGDQLRFTTNGNKWERIPNAQAVSSVAGLTGPIDSTALKLALALVRADVGLANVNNTSDANKPISNATQAALNLKASTSLASSTANGLQSIADKIKIDAIPSASTLNSAIVGPPINLLDYCTDDAQRTAVLAGSVGIDIPMTAALVAAGIQGRSIFIPGRGTYRTSTNGYIQNASGISIIGEGCTIKKVGNGPLFLTGPTTDPVMAGTRLDDGLLPAGSKTVVMLQDAPFPFEPGQWVVITDRTRIYPIAGNNRAEMQLIQGKTYNSTTRKWTVTFWSPTKYDYLGGAVGGGYARIVAAPVVKNTVYRDFNVDMDETIDVTNSGESHAFDNRWLLNPRFENIRISNFVKVGLLFKGCVGWQVSNVHFNVGGSADTGTGEPGSSEGLGGFSYGVCEAGPCIGGRMDNCTSVNIRHTYTTVSLSLVNGNGGNNMDYGEPVGTVVSNCTAIYPVNAAFDTHEAGWGISFYNNKVVGGHYVGMQIRSRGTTVNGLEVIDTVGSALWIRGGATVVGDNAYASDVVWDNVVARNTNTAITFDSIDWRERGCISDEAKNTRGGTVYVFDSGGPAVTLYRNGGNDGGTVNRIVAKNVCKLATTNKFVFHVPSPFTGNVYVDEIFSVSDGKVVNVVRGAGSAGNIVVKDITASGHTGADILVSGGMTISVPGSSSTFTADPRLWRTPTTSNNWVANTSQGQSVPKHRLNSAGQVVLKGHGQGGPAGSAVFILPVGQRAPEIMRFTTTTFYGTCVVTIDPGGAVIITTPADNSGTKHFSLDGIVFDVLP